MAILDIPCFAFKLYQKCTKPAWHYEHRKFFRMLLKIMTAAPQSFVTFSRNRLPGMSQLTCRSLTQAVGETWIPIRRRGVLRGFAQGSA